MKRKPDLPEQPIAQEAYDTMAEAYAALVDTKPHLEHLINSEEKRQVPIDRIF